MSKSPMITIKEAKEILEDFSPLNKEDSEKELKKKFKVAVSNKERKEDNNSMHNIGTEKPNDALIVNVENKEGIHSTDIKKAA